MVRIKVIKVSRDFLDPKKLKRAIDNALDGGSMAAKADFDVTTHTWKHRPQFVIEKKSNAREIYTTDKIYMYVTRGTKPHMIYPRFASVLKFNSKFRAKSRPAKIRGNAALRSYVGYTGGRLIYARRVRHPGTKPRNFDQAVAAASAYTFPSVMQRALDAEV